MKKLFFSILLIAASQLSAQQIVFEGKPELFAPGIVSTEKSEVKITFSKDGSLMLWGTIGWENGKGGWDIWQSSKTEFGWSKPVPSSFNSGSNDFDPAFSADGKRIYFFSNRPGGFGGDDIYYAEFDAVSGKFGTPVNMGSLVNTPGDEWGPAESPDGQKFIFCTNGLKGEGEHDIFICERLAEGWSMPIHSKSINSAADDFDPAILNDDTTIILTRKLSDDEAFLYISYLIDGKYTIPVRVDRIINPDGTWTLGASVTSSDKSHLYFSSNIKENTKGRMDIYRIKYRLMGK